MKQIHLNAQYNKKTPLVYNNNGSSIAKNNEPKDAVSISTPNEISKIYQYPTSSMYAPKHKQAAETLSNAPVSFKGGTRNETVETSATGVNKTKVKAAPQRIEIPNGTVLESLKSIAQLDDTQYERVSELIKNGDKINTVIKFNDSNFKIECDGKNITYTKQGEVYKITVRINGKQTTAVKYHPNGIKEVEEGLDSSEKVVSVYNNAGKLTKKSYESMSDRFLRLLEEYHYDKEQITKKSTYHSKIMHTQRECELVVETKQELNADMTPKDNVEIVTAIKFPAKLKEAVLSHIGTQNQLNANGLIYGGHYSEFYHADEFYDGDKPSLEYKAVDKCELTSNDGRSSKVYVQNSPTGNITYTFYNHGDEEYELKLIQKDSSGSAIQYNEQTNSGATGIKTVVPSKEYNKMFEQLDKIIENGHACVLRENNNFSVYYYSSADDGERIYWFLPPSGKTLYPVIPAELPTSVKEFFNNTEN